jgi:hypothetical protein
MALKVTHANIATRGAGKDWWNAEHVVSGSGSYDVTLPPYNAKGDGVTDDTAAIQAAIDAGALINGEVVCPPGRYLISAPLVIASGIVSLSGSSTMSAQAASFSTAIKLVAGSNCRLLTVADGALANVHGILWDGNKTNQTVAADGIVFEGTLILRSFFSQCVVTAVKGRGVVNHRRELFIDSVRIDACADDGFVTDASSDVFVRDLVTGENGGHGMVCRTNFVQVYNLASYLNATDGLVVDGVSGGYFSGVVTDLNGTDGIVLNTDGGYCQDHRFVGGRTSGNSYLSVGGGSNLAFTGTAGVSFNSFIGMRLFGLEESTRTNKPAYQFEDRRTGFSVQQGRFNAFVACTLHSGPTYTATAAYHASFPSFAEIVSVGDEYTVGWLLKPAYASTIQIGTHFNTMPAANLAVRGDSPIRFFGSDGNADQGSYLLPAANTLTLGIRTSASDSDYMTLMGGTVRIVTPTYADEAAAAALASGTLYKTATGEARIKL